jgi:hypothetical protein
MSEQMSLQGRELVYGYPQLGMRFRLLFDSGEFTFQRLHHAGEAPLPPMAYQARRLENGMYISAFHMPDESYVTSFIDPAEKTLYNSMVWGPEQRRNFDWVRGIEEAEIEIFGLAEA